MQPHRPARTTGVGPLFEPLSPQPRAHLFRELNYDPEQTRRSQSAEHPQARLFRWRSGTLSSLKGSKLEPQPFACDEMRSVCARGGGRGITFLNLFLRLATRQEARRPQGAVNVVKSGDKPVRMRGTSRVRSPSEQVLIVVVDTNPKPSHCIALE